MKKSFDAVQFMRKRRKQMDEEDSGLDWKARQKKMRSLLEGDTLWENLKDRIAGQSLQQPNANDDREARPA